MTDTTYPNAPGHVAGSDTSEAAADSVADTAASMRARVLAHIEACANGATCDDVEEALGMLHQTASARCRGLVLRDAIHDSGQRRKTRTGRPAAVYVAGPAVKPKPAPAVEPVQMGLLR